MTTPPDLNLRLALAKMLPRVLLAHPNGHVNWLSNSGQEIYTVKDTEWLHVCWLVEQTLTLDQQSEYTRHLLEILFNDRTEDLITHWHWHASWQQRATALAKVLGVEI